MIQDDRDVETIRGYPEEVVFEEQSCSFLCLSFVGRHPMKPVAPVGGIGPF